MQKHSSVLLVFILSCLFILNGHRASASREKFLSEYGLNQLPGDSLVRVSDTGYINNASQIEAHYLRRNIISLSINEHSSRYIGGNVRSVVYIRYRLKNYSNQLSDYMTDSLVVSYDTLKGFNLRDYRVYDDVLESSVQVTGYATNNSSIDIRPVLKLTNEIELDRSYKWTGDNCTIKINGLSHMTMPLEVPGTNDFDELPVSWAPLLGSDEYDLEWTWIDEEAPGYTTPTAAVFTNNASRVTVRGVSYNIPLLFDGKGKLCYRVRPVKLPADGSRKTGLWSHQNGGVINSFMFNGFQRKLNWQATTSFAEEGKRKSVVNYFDGSLRSRQTVTKDNSTTVDGKNNAVIAETFYDYQGRAAVQVLPAPSVSTLLTYVKGFNKNINSQDYDKDDFDKLGEGEKCCGKAAGKMDPAISGAAHYYSPQSVFLAKDASKSYSKLVPDADSTPFIQTEYSLDNTGRIARQGGVGKDYQLSKHDTRYSYAKPSQRELDILFGTEAGDASHYFKNMVRDANGQYSVSYMDMQGRTIATALAGKLPDSIKLDDIAEALQFRATDTIIRPGNQLKEGLSIIKSESMVVPLSGEYKIEYHLEPEKLVLENCAKEDICYDCLYDFEIMMIEDCGDTLFYDTASNISLDRSVIETTIDGVCNGKPFAYSKILNVPEGSYTLTKRLSINRASLAAYRDNLFLVQNTCRDYESFLKEEIEILKAELPCVVSCEDCFTALGSEAAFIQKYKEASGVTGAAAADIEQEAAAAYKTAYASCAALCPSESAHYTVLEMTEDEMLGDVTPPTGIYANPALNRYVFGKTGSLYNFQNGSLVYKNEQGIVDRVVNSKGETVFPNALTPDEFIEHFKPSWAQELIKLHPEKCKLDRAKTWAASYKYDDLLRSTTTYADALSKGLLNGPSTSLDPAMNSSLVGDVNFRNTFSTRLLEYTIGSGNTSIWHLAVKMIDCVNSPASNCISSSDYGNRTTYLNVGSWCEADRDMAWTSFRSLYLSVKDKLLYERLSNLCSSTEGLILDENRRFVPPGIGSETPTGPNDRVTGDLNTAIADACNGYTSLWMSNLEQCRYTEAQWATLSAHLVAICKDGGDIDHFNGASSVRTGVTNAYANSFVDAVKRFNTENGINTNAACNGYLIVQPAPYGSPDKDLANTIVTQPPLATSCLCKNLNYYYEEKQSNGNSSLSLGAYLRNFYGAEITDAAADALRSLCNTPPSTCKFLPEPYVVGPVLMNCAPLKPACLDCDQVKSYHLLFKSAFAGLQPTYEANDTTQQQVNLLYQRFMNYHTGFSEDYIAYLDFLQSCTLSDTSSNCKAIDSIYRNFKQNILPGITGGANCRTAFTSYFNTGSGRSYSYNFTQLDSLYRNNCNKVLDLCGAPALSGDSCAVIKYYMDLYTQEMSRTDTLYPVDIVTSLGNPTPADGPKGVFDVTGKLLGNTTGGTPLQIKQSFAAIWNNGTENRKVGQLLVNNEALYLHLKSGAVYPCNGIVGMRYYQMDIENYKIWGLHTGIGSYVSWGDATGDHIMGAFTNTKTQSSLLTTEEALTVPANNTPLTYLPLRYTLNHDYTDSVNRTITVYHPDTLGVVGNEIVSASARYIYNLKKLRGYFPKETVVWGSYSSMDTSFNTYNKIVNFAEVSGMRFFVTRADYLAPWDAYYFKRYHNGPINKFGNLTGKSKIERVRLDTQGGGLVDAVNKVPITDMFPNWNVNFPDMASIDIRGNHLQDYNRDNIRYKFPKLKYLSLYLYGMNTASVDAIIADIATTSQVCGGYFKIYTYGEVINIPGLNAANIAYLQSRGWKLEILNNTTSTVFNPTGSCTTASAYQIQPAIQRSGFPMRSKLSEYLNARTGFNISAARLTQKLAACSIVSPCSRVLPVVPAGKKLCGRSRAIFPVVEPVDAPPCADTLLLAGTKATMRYEAYLDSLKNAFEEQYINRCLKVSDHEKLTIEKPNFEYHYTLYYYDQGGNLVRTVPPESVNLYRKSLKAHYGVASVELALNALESEIVARRAQGTLKSLPYTMATHYRYNSLNQVTEQRTPDAGTSYFWYDELGRLVLSRNAKQALENKYSYTRYDVLGRIIEVGETGERTGTVEQLKTVARDPGLLLAWLNTNISTKPLTQITRTVYDITDDNLVNQVEAARFSQHHLRNRVSYTKVVKGQNSALESLTAMPADNYFPNYSSYYDYDIHGNVRNLVHRFEDGEMGDTEDRDVIKHIRYDYDLVSGKVNMVSYQPGYKTATGEKLNFKDRFYHRYEYDAENKLTEVYTSTDSVYWEKDAAYQYYRHGPLARVELGQAKVQGIDYAYTVQGWLKGINSSFADAGKDIGGDGKLAPSNGGNHLFARDAIGFSLLYNGSDYKATGSGVAGIFTGIDKTLAGAADHYRPLFNGNIMGTTLSFDNSVKVPGQPENNYSYAFGKTFTRLYTYDKLNRIKKSQSYTELQDNQFVKFNVSKGLNESFEYDANGNILRLDRYGVRGASFEALLMDSLEYQYLAGTNQLKYVKDNVTDRNRFKTDIDDQGQNNYSYDAIGNLVSDKSENIKKITWTVYGKIDSIYKYNGNTIAYRYDAAGNRIGKTVKKGGVVTETSYVRDAQGNVLAVYEYNNEDDKLYLTETHLYGSSRLGVYKRKVEIWGDNFDNNYEQPFEISGIDHYGKKRNFERGNKFFELSNHLGNVLATVSDRKLAVGSGTEVSYYKADIKTASDYYAFGAPIDVRNYPHAVWQMQTPAEDGGSAGSPVTLYLHSFTGLPTGSVTQPYTEEAEEYSDYLSNMSWTTNHPGGLTIQGGQSGQALAIPTAQPASSTMTLSLDVRPDYEASVSGFSFYIRNDNSNGYKNWNLVINGQSVGSGVVTSSFVQQSVTLSNPVRGLKGAVTVQLTVTNSNGSTATNYLRVDEFKLVGFVERSPMLTGGNKVIHEADFTSSTGGWEPNNGITTVSLDNGRLKVAASDVWGAPRKRLSLVSGKTYRISFTWDKGNGSALTVAFKRPNEAVFYWGDITSINSSGRYTMFFTVPAGESTLDWFFDQPPGTSTIPSYYWLDDIVIEEVDDPVGEGSEVGDSDGKGYRYGFNGKENDNEISGQGNNLDFGARIYDSRLGRWLSRDIVDKAFISPYNVSSNNPINYLDPDGQDEIHFFYVIKQECIDGRIVSAKSTKYSVIVKNNEPNVFIHHKIQLRYDNDKLNNLLSSQVDTRFYPDIPGEKTGLTNSYLGLITDDDRKTLIKFIDEYGLSKQDVDIGYSEISAPGATPSDRMAKSTWWSGVFAEKAAIEKEEDSQKAKMSFVATAISFVLPELAIARLERGLWLGRGAAALGNDVATIKSASNLGPKKGWFDVIVHGDPYYVGSAFNIGGKTTTVEEVYSLMLSNGYKQGTSIRLISCNAGKGVAQELANLSGAKVIAPSSKTLVNSAGKLITEDGSKYKVFKPIVSE